MADRPQIFVHLLPSLIPPGALAGGVAVVVDVLRATTVMVHALASGCEAVIPCLEIDDARRVAAGLPPGRALLGGERQGLPIEGFDLGNSPGDYTPEVCRGKTLVMTTTNGTRAILASREADRVLIGAFVNLKALLGVLETIDRPLHIVCAGTDGRVSLEDSALAGSLAYAWADRLYKTFPGIKIDYDDAAEIVYEFWSHECEKFDLEESWDLAVADYFSRFGRGGRRVRELGLMADIEDAARDSRFEVVPELRRDPLRIVRVGGV